MVCWQGADRQMIKHSLMCPCMEGIVVDIIKGEDYNVAHEFHGCLDSGQGVTPFINHELSASRSIHPLQ